VAAGGSDKAAEQAAILKQGFAETETFWKKREKPDAIKWAAEARGYAESLEAAVTAGKWEEAKGAVGSLQQTCAACHGAYRQRDEDGYRIRSDK
jgi:cytochrome c556